MIIIIMGVSGSGKTTIGKQLADSLQGKFYDADDFHSQENIHKMRHDIPLTDRDRIPWLQNIQVAIKRWLDENTNIVLACSALKASYRQYLLLNEQIKLVYLKGSFELIEKRLKSRQNHFMTEKLLQSQFDALEIPNKAIIVDIAKTEEAIVEEIIQKIGDVL